MREKAAYVGFVFATCPHCGGRFARLRATRRDAVREKCSGCGLKISVAREPMRLPAGVRFVEPVSADAVPPDVVIENDLSKL